jgi:hypothetical protein
MTSCGNQPIFKDGKGCGACYQVSFHHGAAAGDVNHFIQLVEAQSLKFLSNHDINVSLGVDIQLNWLNFPDTMPQE